MPASETISILVLAFLFLDPADMDVALFYNVKPIFKKLHFFMTDSYLFHIRLTSLQTGSEVIMSDAKYIHHVIVFVLLITHHPRISFH